MFFPLSALILATETRDLSRIDYTQRLYTYSVLFEGYMFCSNFFYF
jgi:hypothetical protein